MFVIFILLFPCFAQLASKEGYLIKLGAVVKVNTDCVFYQQGLSSFATVVSVIFAMHAPKAESN